MDPVFARYWRQREINIFGLRISIFKPRRGVSLQPTSHSSFG